MSITLKLKPEVEASIEAQASARGLSVQDYLQSVIERVAALMGNNDRALAFLARPGSDDRALALLARWEAEDATDDPNEIEARNREWDELKANLDANRSSFRKLFPRNMLSSTRDR